MTQRQAQSGFTLVELIMVIVIMGVIGGAVAVFMRSPIDAYFDTARRGGIADVADTTVRRMARDIRKALPNSIRLGGTGSNQCIEFIPTRMGGRYRVEEIAAGDGTSLDFSTTDATFNMLGQNTGLLPDQQIRANDVVAIYNLGIPGADAYAGDNTAVVSSVVDGAETVVNIAAKRFPLASGSNRFHVIPVGETIVSYMCSGNRLYRNANYAYSPSCPTPTAGTTPIIAMEATCNFAYSAADVRNALVQLSLTFANSGESVSIYHEVHVNNTP